MGVELGTRAGSVMRWPCPPAPSPPPPPHPVTMTLSSAADASSAKQARLDIVAILWSLLPSGNFGHKVGDDPVVQIAYSIELVDLDVL